jgi:hypothetical protein
MTTLVIAAIAAIQQIPARQYHQAAIKIEIAAFDKCFNGLVPSTIWFDAIVHTVQGIPCFLRLHVLAIL